jgi:hypothetical protein
LLVTCFSGCDRRDVLAEINARFGGNAEHAFSRGTAAKVAKVDERHANDKRTDAARRIWREAQPAAGTLVASYLRSRSIDIPPPPTIRFHKACWHSGARRPFPAMVAAVQGPDGRLVAVQRTYLRPDGSGKADVNPAKKALGPTSGGAVRLAAASDGLLIGEGIERTLSAMQASGRPAWATLGTSGMKGLILPDHVRELVIIADADPPGIAAANAAADRWTGEGRTVRIAVPPAGRDFNDCWRECAA